MSYAAVLCMNFEQTDAVNKITGDCEASILYGILKWQSNGTKLEKNGKKVIARTREKLGQAIGRKVSAVDRFLEKLKGFNLIEGSIGMYYGNKRMFISCKEDVSMVVDAQKLFLMTKHTGGNLASTALSYFAFVANKKPIYHKGETWVRVSRRRLAKLLTVSPKTADAIVRRLAHGDIIQYEGHIAYGERQYLIHINDDFYDTFSAELAALREVNKRAKVEKTRGSIRIKKDTKENIINNNTLVDENGTIILSKKERSYLASAISRTLARCTAVTWGYGELWAHMKYVLTTPKQRNGATNFVHCINRAMLLVREGRWKMPFGFEKYSSEGRVENERLRAMEKKTDELKKSAEFDLGLFTEEVKEEPKAVEPSEAEKERAAKMADLERRWSEARYGR